MQKFGVRICQSTAENILTGFSYTLRRIPIVPERRNTQETIDSSLQYALIYINLSSRFSENQIVFIDKVGSNVSLRCSLGRSLGGTSASLSVPAKRSINISICFAISRSEIHLYESRLSAYNSPKKLRSTRMNIAILRMDIFKIF
ncbi:hypothetical protein HZS_3527 [Henneguya salminicola]|nr:hypothetical protein HZS_3527 [Henneguya salminicola]